MPVYPGAATTSGYSSIADGNRGQGPWLVDKRRAGGPTPVVVNRPTAIHLWLHRPRDTARPVEGGAMRDPVFVGPTRGLRSQGPGPARGVQPDAVSDRIPRIVGRGRCRLSGSALNKDHKLG